MLLTRTEIVNQLIEENQYSHYLEIGVGDGKHYEQIKCFFKTNVDPVTDCKDQQDTYKVVNKMTSDDFFKQNTQLFDIVFIDGLHEYKQVYRDIKNSLQFLQPNGTIVCHDMLPSNEYSQRDDYLGNETWNGSCWKALAQLRIEETDLSIVTVDTDFGCAIIQRGTNILYPVALEEVLHYSYFKKHKQELMQIISEDEFTIRYLPKTKKVTAKNTRIAGVVVLYNSSPKLEEYILSYLHCIEKLYIVDNNKDDNRKHALLSLSTTKIEYLHFPTNEFIAKPINIVAKKAIEDGFGYLLLMDDDSYFLPGFSIDYIVTWMSMDSKIALLNFAHDVPNEKFNGLQVINNSLQVYLTLEDAITSGSIVQLNIFQHVGGYREELVIYELDREFCLKCNLCGFKIYKTCNLILQHNTDDIYYAKYNRINIFKRNKVKLTWRTPLIYYYFARNIKYITNTYGRYFPTIISDRKGILRHTRRSMWRYFPKPFTYLSYYYLGILHYKSNQMGKLNNHRSPISHIIIAIVKIIKDKTKKK